MLREVRVGRASEGGEEPGCMPGIDVIVRAPDWQSAVPAHRPRIDRRRQRPLGEAAMAARLTAPVDRILGRAHMIGSAAHGPLSARYVQYAGNIAFAGRHLRALMRDVVRLGGASNAADLIIEPFDARAAVEDVLAIVRPAAERKSMDIGFRAGPPLSLLADQHRFDQILTNLLSNAVKFTPSGGRVEIAFEEGNPVRLFVRDSGPGIAEADAERVFDRFERLGSSEEGTGLGLYIARAHARIMGGELYLGEFDKPGATFCLELPPGD